MAIRGLFDEPSTPAQREHFRVCMVELKAALQKTEYAIAALSDDDREHAMNLMADHLYRSIRFADIREAVIRKVAEADKATLFRLIGRKALADYLMGNDK